MKRSIYNVGFLVTGVFVIFILYFILQSAFNTVLFPTIGEIGTRFLDFFHVKGLISFGYTLLRLLISLAISFVVSIGISYLYFLFKPSLMIFKPLMFLLKVSPIVAIVLYVQVLTASASMLAPYVVTTMIMIPLMTEAYVSGINSIDKTILDVLKLEGANRSYQFFKIIFPMISENIVLSMFQSIGLGLKVVVMVEYFCFLKYGIGSMMNTYYTLLDIAGLIATIVFVALIAVILEVVLIVLKKKVFKIA